MRLTPAERDRLVLAGAAAVARRRHERGLRLNVPEAIALICDEVIERARDGLRHADVVRAAQSVLTEDDVLPGVVDIVPSVTVEAVFDDGTRLVIVPDPFGTLGGRGAPDAARPGAVLPAPVTDRVGPSPVEIAVRNTAAVAVTVTSHWHFFEANAALRFDRRAAYGMHLDVPAGMGVRFEPGTVLTVGLVPIAGRRVAVGFAGLVDGPLDAPGAEDGAMARASALGYLSVSPGEAP
ncbi:MAG TPA: urease subunit gamma [Phycicoccus elongatus]|nr:urease subunit gamma [Phycicoccus elongatus]